MLYHGLIAKYRRWKLINNTVRALSMLDDRELNDLGIGRWRIAEIAKRSVD